jgi:hypothetical protein
MEASMKYPMIAFLTLAALPLSAAPLQSITPHEALANRGQCVSVQGTATVRDDPQRPGLDVDLDGKSSPAFGYIEPQDKAQFPNLASMDGQRVNISGVVQFYLGRAEIKMTSAKQLMPATNDESAGLPRVGPEFAKGGMSNICG